MTALLLVALGSAVGAPSRYLLDRLIQSRHERILPWGTWTVNVTGSFLLGLTVGLAPHDVIGDDVVTGITTGFLGGYTTFSTFSWETMRLAEDGAFAAAGWNVAIGLVAGTAAAACGLLAGGALG